MCMDHCIYKCCGLSFSFHKKCHVFVSCLTTIIKTTHTHTHTHTHTFSHFTLYIKGPFTLFVMAGMKNRVSTTPCFCRSSFGRGRETTVWRTGVCRGRNAVVDFSLSRSVMCIYIYISSSSSSSSSSSIGATTLGGFWPAIYIYIYMYKISLH